MWSTAEKSLDLNCDREPTGYLHDDYAGALSEFGEPIRLRQSQGPFPAPLGSTPWDAIRFYPAGIGAVCQRMSKLSRGRVLRYRWSRTLLVSIGLTI